MQSFKHAMAITKSDSAKLPKEVQAIHCGGAGNVRVTMRGGQTVTFDGNPAGSRLCVQAVQVHSLSTTATGLVGLW